MPLRCIHIGTRRIHPSINDGMLNDGMLNLIFAAVEAELVEVKTAEASVV